MLKPGASRHLIETASKEVDGIPSADAQALVDQDNVLFVVVRDVERSGSRGAFPSPFMPLVACWSSGSTLRAFTANRFSPAESISSFTVV